jgi:hypothetical protein
MIVAGSIKDAEAIKAALASKLSQKGTGTENHSGLKTILVTTS